MGYYESFKVALLLFFGFLVVAGFLCSVCLFWIHSFFPKSYLYSNLKYHQCKHWRALTTFLKGLISHHISNSSGWAAHVLRKWKGACCGLSWACWEFSLSAAVSDWAHSSNAVLNLLSLLRWGVLKREWRLVLSSTWNYFKQSKSGCIQTESPLGDSRVLWCFQRLGGHSWAGFM